MNCTSQLQEKFKLIFLIAYDLMLVQNNKQNIIISITKQFNNSNTTTNVHV